MTKTFMMLGATLSMSFAYGQEYNRVGINTEVPQATLDVRETPLSLLPTGTPQGVLFPNFSSDERTAFTANVKEGTMIYNTDLDCVEQYTFRNNKLDWYCSCLCDENTAVIEQDDDVLLELYSLTIILTTDSGPYSEKGETYLSASIYNGDVYENTVSKSEGGSMMVGVNHEGKSVRNITGTETTGIRYNAQESGKYTEKRMTYTGSYFVNNETTSRTISFDLVIPAGRVEAGEGVLPVYVELPEGVNVIHPAGGASYSDSSVDVSGSLAHKPFNITFEYLSDEL